MERLIIFYDGYCVFCNFWIRKLCRWDSKDRLRFAPLNSKMAEDMIQKTSFDRSQIDSIIAWDQSSRVRIEAAAIFLILNRLGGLWSLLVLFRLIPLPLSNRIYRYIAKNRIRWFGKNDQCPLPDPKYIHKFL